MNKLLQLLNTFNSQTKNEEYIRKNAQNHEIFSPFWKSYYSILKNLNLPSTIFLNKNTGPWMFENLKENPQARIALKQPKYEGKPFNLLIWIDLGYNKDLYQDENYRNMAGLGFHIGIDNNSKKRKEDKVYYEFKDNIYERRVKLFKRIQSKYRNRFKLLKDDYPVYVVDRNNIKNITQLDIEELLNDLGIILNKLYIEFYSNCDQKESLKSAKKLNTKNLIRYIEQKELEIEQKHKKLQEQIREKLKEKYEVKLEIGYNDKADIVIEKEGSNKLIIIEIKISKTSNDCLKRGIGQLLYYRHELYKKKENRDIKLILFAKCEIENTNAELINCLSNQNVPQVYFISDLKNLYKEIKFFFYN